MAKAKAALYLRYQTPEGKQSPYRPVAWDSKQRLRPGWCLVAGVAEQHKDVTYHLRRKKSGKWAWESVGADPNTALAKRDALSCGTAVAIAAKLPAAIPVETAGGVTIDAARRISSWPELGKTFIFSSKSLTSRTHRRANRMRTG
jgi:hypothetical protein